LQPQRKQEPDPNFNYDRYDSLLNLLTTIENINAAGLLIQLYAIKHVQKADYAQLLNTLKDAIKYNAIQGRFKKYFYLSNISFLSKATDADTQKNAIAFVDTYLSLTSDAFAKSSIYQLKSQLLNAYGDEEGSKQAAEEAKINAREGTIKSGGKAIKAGLIQ
jgi:hypothetical protein